VKEPEFGTGWWRAEREFPVAPGSVTSVRAWARSLFAPTCDARDRCVLALSELAANAAAHGSGLMLRISLEHGTTGLRCVFTEIGGPARKVVAVDEDALAEMEMLAALTDGAAVDVMGLRESGRGLALLAKMCGERLEITQGPSGVIVCFKLVGCRCQLRMSFPLWGVLPPDRETGMWRGVRSGFPELTAAGPLELLEGIEEAERCALGRKRTERETTT
jgi:anti-sigma regulatory factor (Ser/Thr protein kinase)